MLFAMSTHCIYICMYVCMYVCPMFFLERGKKKGKLCTRIKLSTVSTQNQTEKTSSCKGT
jgi:hypothetical protein